MTVNTEQLLSGSINGRPILTLATTTPGTLVHTATSATSTLDNIWLYFYNNHTADVNVTVEWGGVAESDQITMGIPYKQGLVLAKPGLPLTGGLVVRAFASVANVVTVVGLVNRRTD